MSQTYVFLPPAACSGAQADLPVQWVADGVSETLEFCEAQTQLGDNWTLVLPVEVIGYLPCAAAGWPAGWRCAPQRRRR